jgi:hypothetical protein
MVIVLTVYLVNWRGSVDVKISLCYTVTKEILMFTHNDYMNYYRHLARSERDDFRPLTMEQFRGLVEHIKRLKDYENRI